MDGKALADLRRSLNKFSLPNLRLKSDALIIPGAAGIDRNDPDNLDDFDPDVDRASESIADAIAAHDAAMTSASYGESTKDAAVLMNHLQNAHEALTGDRVPDGLSGWTNDPDGDDDFDPDVDAAIGSTAAAIIAHDKAMTAGRGGSNKDAALLMNHLQNAHVALAGTRVPDGMTGWTKTQATRELRKALADLSLELAAFRPRFSGPSQKVQAMRELRKSLADLSLELAAFRPRFSSASFQIKRSPSGAEISGYASTFGMLDDQGDIVEPGAFTASLAAYRKAGTQPLMLWQHDQDQPIGVWETVKEDAKGLFVKGRILTTLQRGSEAASLIEAGAIRDLSIGYKTLRFRMVGKVRHLLEVKLYEISLVSLGSNSGARLRNG
jgi:HK97 family phage prohead protease